MPLVPCSPILVGNEREVFYWKNMSTEIPVLYNQIKKEFDTALKNAAEGEYVPKPKALYRYTKLRREAVSEMRNLSLSTKKELEERSISLAKEYGINKLEATNIVLEVRATEDNLRKQGVFFGNEVFNFAIDRPVITKEEEQKIIKASDLAMTALGTASMSDLKKLFSGQQMFPTEAKFEENALSPNAARIDFILTETGPKIIEVNTQWVDAINALSGFAFVFGDLKVSKTVTEKFAQAFPQNSSLAIVNVQQTLGSRELGATKELEVLAKKLLQTDLIKRCEVIDPEKVRLSYLKGFDSFYLNFDPRALGYNEPDWIDIVLKKILENPKAMFPSWRPLLDKKIALTVIPNTEGYIVPTISLSDYKPINSPIIIKGDGYSLNSVVTSFDNNFQEYLELAKQEMSSYVVQPFLESKRFSAWVYDSGSKKIKYIRDGYTKLNVWWLNGQVIGMLVTMSETPLISDKGYNTYPLIKN